MTLSPKPYTVLVLVVARAAGLHYDEDAHDGGDHAAAIGSNAGTPALLRN